MDALNAITGGYKKQFIEDIIEGMNFRVGKYFRIGWLLLCNFKIYKFSKLSF